MPTMSMARILNLKSTDFPNLTLVEALPQIDITSDYYKRLKRRMRKTGINLVPVLVEAGGKRKKEYLCNGHHRVKIAWELKHERMNITDDGEESGWSDELSEMII